MQIQEVPGAIEIISSGAIIIPVKSAEHSTRT